MKAKYATRMVLLDGERVAVLNVGKYGYYKIPGGGIEDGEDLNCAAKREVMEEAGCDSEIIAELGRIESDIAGWGLHDISDGFIGRVIGEKKKPEFDDFEKERDFRLEWAESLDVAIEMFELNKVSEPDAAVLQGRDLEFLKLANRYLKSL